MPGKWAIAECVWCELANTLNELKINKKDIFEIIALDRQSQNEDEIL